MDLNLKGRRALVTGSTAGIGLAIATSLAREGARVVVTGRTQTGVDKAVGEVKAATGGEVVGFAGDLGTATAAEELVRRRPGFEILVNNLGIFEPKSFDEIPDSDWMRFFEVNVLSGVRLARHYLPAMLKNKWGRIIFISSESGQQIPAEMIHYGMTKTAQVAIARGLAESVAGSGVTVNSVLVGPTASEGASVFVEDMARQQGVSTAEIEKQFFASVRPTSLLKRFETPEEIGKVVAFVASQHAVTINGAAVPADGGVIRSVF